MINLTKQHNIGNIKKYERLVADGNTRISIFQDDQYYYCIFHETSLKYYNHNHDDDDD